MLILVFLKMLADLGFYSTFAGLLGAIPTIEIQPFVIVVSVPAMALVFTLSYLLRNRKMLRFLPFLLVPLAAFLPGFNLPAAVFLLPMVVYMVILAAKKLYEPDYPNARDLFSLGASHADASARILRLQKAFRRASECRDPPSRSGRRLCPFK